MNIYQAEKLAKEYAMEYWGLKLNVPIVENNRLTRSLGRMCWRRNNLLRKYTPLKIDLAGRLLRNYSDETIISVIKHELCHWALLVLEKPFSDGHPVFEKELQRIGASSSFTIQQAGNLHTVVCKGCKKEAVKNESRNRLKKYVVKGYTSRCCGERLEWGPTVYIEDRNGEADNSQPRRIQREQRQAAMSAAIASARVLEQPTVTATVSSLNEILIPGPRGVTNKQMIPAIKKAIDLNNKELIVELRNQYQSVLEGSYKYLGKTYQEKYDRLMG